MSKDKFQQAQILIKVKKYDEARQLLQAMDHPKATEWIMRIDAINPPKKSRKMPGWVKALGVIAGLAVLLVVVAYAFTWTPIYANFQSGLALDLHCGLWTSSEAEADVCRDSVDAVQATHPREVATCYNRYRGDRVTDQGWSIASCLEREYNIQIDD